MLLLRLSRLTLLLLNLLLGDLMLLLLLSNLVADRRRCWNPHVAIGGKGPVDSRTGRLAMVDVGKLRAIGAGRALILQLGLHRGRVLFMLRSQFGWPGVHLDSARAAVEADPVIVPVGDVVVVHVALDGDIHVVDRAVVIEVPAAPISALIAEAEVAVAVVHTAVEADVTAPVAAIEAVAVIPIAPVAGRPQSTLVGSLDPCAGHPVIAVRGPRPIAGRPQVTVAGSLGLRILGQRRRGLAGVVHRLRAVA